MNQKLALLGSGKTGREILELYGHERVLGPFNRTHRLDSAEQIAQINQNAFALIVFIPGSELPDLVPILKQITVPIVCGSTGVEWSSRLHQELAQAQHLWIHAANFSLGMALVIRHSLQQVARALTHFPDYELALSETHHIHKKDRPSGTALRWRDWVGLPNLEISSFREGDVFGIHTMKFTTSGEEITITHKALNRKLFAQGAIWAAEMLLDQNLRQQLGHGLVPFEKMVDLSLNLAEK